MKTVNEIRVGDHLIELKSKRVDHLTSGWSVIAFTPHCSIRCTRTHDPKSMEGFVAAIVNSVDAPVNDKTFDAVEDAIRSIID